MKLTVLGYYGGFPFNGVGTSSYLLQSNDYNLLIDCGSNSLLTLEDHIDPMKLNAVILSHYHHDHTADLGVLQYYWQLHSHNESLPIYGNTEDPLNFASLTWPGATIANGYSALQPLNLGPFLIKFMRTHHPVPAFAMQITEKTSNKLLVYTADTNYFDDLVPFAQSADVLITDTNFFADKQGLRWHMTSTESGKLARLSNSKSLLISHLPQTDKLSKLLKQTKESAGHSVNVEIAKRNLSITI